MQGVQGIHGRVDGRGQAAYEEYSILGRCPECREGLVYAGEERTELTCSYCGIVVSRADYTREDGSSAPSVSKSEPLGSYIVADTESASVPEGPRLRVGEADAEHRRARRTDADVLGADEQDRREAVPSRRASRRLPTSRRGGSSPTGRPTERPSRRYRRTRSSTPAGRRG